MEEHLIETIGYRGLNINIYYDFDPMNPCEDWDMLGSMACWHSRYNLGHEQPKCEPDDFMVELAMEFDPTVEDRIDYWESQEGWVRLMNKHITKEGGYNHDSIQAASNECNKRIDSIIQKALDKYYIILPLFLYDHSGITMNTSGFNCPWDSGQVGIIYISKKKAKEEFKWILMTKKRKEKSFKH